MPGRGRVLDALNLEEPDRVPLFDFIYEPKSFENILGIEVPEITPGICVKGHKSLGLDMMCISPGPRRGWANKTIGNTIVDEWGIKYRSSGDFRALPWYLEGPIKAPEMLDDYEMPDPNAEGRLEFIEDVHKLVGDDMAIAASFPIGGPLTAASFLTRFDSFLKYLITTPDFAQRLLDEVTDFCCSLGASCIDDGIEIIFINEDLGFIDGPFISPGAFRNVLLPCLERIVRTMKRKGAKVLLHSDGNIKALLNDLVAVGIEGLHPIERKAKMDIGELKSLIGDKMALIGNVDASSVLQWGTMGEIARQTLECIEIAANGGGYILASDHSIHPGIPGENARFMFKTASQHNYYPARS